MIANSLSYCYKCIGIKILRRKTSFSIRMCVSRFRSNFKLMFVTWRDDFNNILVAKHIPYKCPVISNLISIPTCQHVNKKDPPP